MNSFNERLSLETLIQGKLSEQGIVTCWRRVPTVSCDLTEYWYALLDAAEQKRAREFRFVEDRNSYVAAHALLRQCLSVYNDKPPQFWRFATEANGKPKLAEHPDMPALHFNLSHCRGLVAVALSADCDVGVDTERSSRHVDQSVWESTLSATEISQLKRLSSQEKTAAQLSFWTMKEALLKASGQGLVDNLTDISCQLAPTELLSTGPLPGSRKHWQLWQQRIDDEFIVSVAAFSQNNNSRHCHFAEMIRPDSLLKS